MKKIYFFLIIILASNISNVNAQLLQWNTFGNAGTETIEPSVANNANISAANLTQGTITAAGNGNRFGGSGWFDLGNTAGGNTLAEAITGNDYIQFTVTPNAGFSFTPTSFVFIWDRSATGPANVALRSSADGYASNLGSVTGIVVSAFATNTITISGLTNITTATTFRLYGYQATGTGGTGGFDQNVASPGVVNVQLNGTTAPTAASSITTGAVTAPPFCADASTTASGSVGFTSTGTFAAETFTALLSDAAGSFASPVIVGSTFITGTDPAGSVPITIPAGTATGAGYKIRVDATGLGITGSVSASAFDIINGALNVSGMGSSFTPTTVTVNWTNPIGCYDEVMMVAKPLTTIAGIPTGDGTAYTADPNFNAGFGTPFDVTGKVVYKGSTSPQTVTNLTTGVLYYFRIFTRKGTNWSNGVEISVTPSTVSLATDYYRSVASGSWASTATWQSSTDSSTWIPATLVPGALAAHVVVQGPDSVYLASNTTTTNLTVKSLGIVNALAFTMTATVRFNLLAVATFYQGGNISAVPGIQQSLFSTSNFHYNGVQAGTTSASLPEFGNLFWEPTPPTAGTLTNTNLLTPFFGGLIVHGNMTINIQGGTAREIRFATGGTISRTHIIDGNLNIISSSSTVVVENGATPVIATLNIGGDLNITAGIFSGLSPTGATGDAVVNLTGNIFNTGGIIQSGTGTGSYTFNFLGNSIADAGTGNSFHNVSIAAGKTVTLNNNSFNITTAKTLTLNGHMILGNNDLVIDGTITGASSSSHIITNGTGLLTRKNMLPAVSTLFPIGPSTTTYNPVTITNNDAATLDFSARVEIGVNPPIGYPTNAVNRTWTIKPSATPSSADVLFEYAPGEGNASFNYASPLEVGQYITSAWNVIKTGIVPTGSYQANVTGITSLAGATASPFVLANLASVLAFDGVAVNYFTGTKQNGTHKLNWKLTCGTTPNVTISLERSADTRNFVSINSINATAVRCSQPFDYTDAQPLTGINYYRLKIVDADGKITYSNTIALINATKGIALMNVAPNPVTGPTFKLNVASARAIKMNLVISDISGRIVNTQVVTLIAGFNSIDINAGNLEAGAYQICGSTAEGRSGVIRLLIQ